ncbi:HEAT repeat domain-containing protein [Kitasatospora sp. NBC_01560]|uniref:HEAT repeat domain-containing protein n=1 Tax=Kitasatospora sp. NBC_01560 TaxID=2975965 RepID=UPI003863EA46
MALDGYAGALTHEDPVVRRAAVMAISKCGDDGVLLAERVVPLLGDPDAEVRRTAVRSFSSWGAVAVPLLQAVRRAGPGAARAGALEALAEVGGEAVMSARDMAALERLVRIKLPDDAPAPIACCFLSWIAVSTGDQGGVMQLLGLSAPRPVPQSERSGWGAQAVSGRLRSSTASRAPGRLHCVPGRPDRPRSGRGPESGPGWPPVRGPGRRAPHPFVLSVPRSAVPAG